jgi:alanine-glyoxylate transaminase/serine-glyoxylate transaminase/serine-pyruvate transaminase
MSPVSFGIKAVEVLDKRKTKVKTWYLDLTMIRQYWGSERLYHHTAPVNMNYALLEALKIVKEEGLEARWQRHLGNHRMLKAGLTAMGIRYISQEGHGLPMLNAVAVPDDVDDARVRRQLLEEFSIEIGGGLGAFKGKAWRIGLMGSACSASNVMLFLAALEKCLLDQGVSFDRGAGVAAAAAEASRL